MKNIIVVSLNPAIDRNYAVHGFKPGKLFRCENPLVSPGGKGVNVSRIISMLGAKVTLLGIFAGINGKFIIDNLISNNVNVIPVFVKGETRYSINILDKNCGIETELLEKGPVVTPGEIEILKNELCKQIEISSGGAVVVFSGGIPEGMYDNIYYELICKANSKGAVCFLDSSSKPLIHGMDVDLVFAKPNLREFGQIAEHLSKETNLQMFHGVNSDNIFEIKNLKKIIEISKELKTENLVITLSGKGALLISGNKILHMIAPAIEPVNTIGSGDSFTAGFAFAYANGMSISYCLKLAGACGASNALFEQVGVIDRDTVDEFIEKIEISEKEI